MKEKIKWTRVIYLIGIIALIVGTLDPLEGSVAIAGGSGLLALSTFVTKDRHRKLFLATFLMITVGVCFLFYISSLGGFGGTSSLSWWWITLILPYPVGWLMIIILLIVRTVKKKKPIAAL